MNKMQLDIVIFPEGEGKNKIYSISSVQIPNVVTQGKTIEEAKERLKEALKLYIEDLPKWELKNIKKEKTPMISRMFL